MICLLHIYSYFYILIYKYRYINIYMDNVLLGQYFKKSFTAKTSAESFWVIPGLILVEFLYTFRAVKLFLLKVFLDVFLITPMLTALKKNPQQVLLFWRPFWGIFLVYFGVFLLYFLNTVWFLMKF